MSRFKLNVQAVAQTEGSARKEVNYDELNAHVIAAAGTADKARSIPGIISGIIDLGMQARDDASIPVTDEDFRKANPTFDGSKAEQDKVIAANKHRENARFEEVDGVLNFRYVQKPVQQVAVTVDFPQILVDKGQFFGESKPLPLRMLLNGEFSTHDGTRIVGRPYSITHTKHEIGGNKSTWAFAKNNGLHKLADACEVLDANKLFDKDHIGDLIGRAAQFQFRVYMKPSKKDPSKAYFTEEIKLAGMVPEGVVIPELPDEMLYMTNVWGDDNDPTVVKHLRLAVKNTIKRAINYEGSDIQKLFDAQSAANGNSAAPQQKAAPVDDTPPQAPTDIEPQLDDDVPF